MQRINVLSGWRKGQTVNVDDRTARLLIKAGKAEETTPKAKPQAASRYRAARLETTTQPEGLSALLKSQLVEQANGLGITLDGSETKADLVTLIESHPGYARRDMRASQ